jgi:hypothetical protein
MLKRLRPDAALVTQFPAILKEEWEKRMGDNGAIIRRLKEELKEKEAAQEKLVLAYLQKQPAIVRIFEKMSAKFEEEIASLKARLTDEEKATFEELLAFSKSLLVDISTAWERADIDQKQRVQNVLFPNGLKYHPAKGILNSENDCLFNQLEDFSSGKMLMARPR